MVGLSTLVLELDCFASRPRAFDAVGLAVSVVVGYVEQSASAVWFRPVDWFQYWL